MINITDTKTPTQNINSKPRNSYPSYSYNATSGAILLWILFQVIVSVIITPIFLFVFTTFFYHANPSGFVHSDMYDALVTLVGIITTIVSVLGTIAIIKARVKIALPPLHFRGWGVKKWLYYSIIAIGLSTVASYALSLLEPLFTLIGLHLNTPSFSTSSNVASNVLLFISVCIVAPIFEELLFRGLILSTLKRFGNMFAIIITSLLFGLAHGNLPQSIPVFFFSLVLCYVVLRTNSLIPSITIHMLNNFISFLELNALPDNKTGDAFVAVIEICFVIGTIVFLLRKRKKIANYIKTHKGEHIRSYFPHICPIIVLLYCGMTILVYLILK